MANFKVQTKSLFDNNGQALKLPGCAHDVQAELNKGLAPEVEKLIQTHIFAQARKEMNLKTGDQVTLRIDGDIIIIKAGEKTKEYYGFDQVTHSTIEKANEIWAQHQHALDEEADLENEVPLLRSRITPRPEQEEEIQGLKDENARLKMLIDQLSNNQPSHDSTGAESTVSHDLLQKLESEMSQLEQNVAQLRSMLSDSKDENAELEQALAAAEAGHREALQQLENTDQREKLSELEQKVTQLRSMLSDSKDENAELKQALAAAEARHREALQNLENTDQREKLSELEQNVTQLRSMLAQSKKENAELRREKDHLWQEIHKWGEKACLAGRLLLQEKNRRIGAEASAEDYIDAISKLSDVIAYLVQEKGDLSENLDEAVKTIDFLRSEIKRLEANQHGVEFYEGEIARLEARIAAQEDELSALTADQHEKEAEIDTLFDAIDELKDQKQKMQEAHSWSLQQAAAQNTQLQRQLAERESQLALLEKEKEAIQTQLGKRVAPERAQALEKQIAALSADIQRLQENHAAALTEAKAKQAAAQKALDEALDQQEAQRQLSTLAVQHLAAEKSRAAALADRVAKLETDLAARAHEVVQEALSEEDLDANLSSDSDLSFPAGSPPPEKPQTAASQLHSQLERLIPRGKREAVSAYSMDKKYKDVFTANADILRDDIYAKHYRNTLGTRRAAKAVGKTRELITSTESKMTDFKNWPKHRLKDLHELIRIMTNTLNLDLTDEKELAEARTAVLEGSDRHPFWAAELWTAYHGIEAIPFGRRTEELQALLLDLANVIGALTKLVDEVEPKLTFV